MPGAVNRQHDRQPHGRLGGGHGDDEEGEHLPGVVQMHAVEGDQGQVDGVEHQLDAHQRHDGVAPHQEANGADGEDHGRQHQVMLDVDHGFSGW